MKRPPNIKGARRLANLDILPPPPFRIVGGGGHVPQAMTLGVCLREADEAAWTSRATLLKHSLDTMEEAPWFRLDPHDDMMDWIEILDMMGLQVREKESLRSLCLLNGLWGYMEAYRIVAHLTKDSQRSIKCPSAWALAVLNEAWLSIEYPADWEGYKQRYKERYEVFPHWTSGTSWSKR